MGSTVARILSEARSDSLGGVLCNSETTFRYRWPCLPLLYPYFRQISPENPYDRVSVMGHEKGFYKWQGGKGNGFSARHVGAHARP